MEINLGNMPDPDPAPASVNPLRRPSECSERDAFELLETAIREQHPDWILRDGSCPMCVAYEYELVEKIEGRTECDGAD